MTPSTPEKCIALYDKREVELWGRAEAEARDNDDQREGEVLAGIFTDYLDVEECGHLDAYQEEVGGETFCMRCRDEDAPVEVNDGRR